MPVKLQDKTTLRNDPERFAGRVALVTGAGSGIGRAAALAFGRQGAAVALVGRRVPELEVVAREIAESGGTATVAPADVTDERAVEKTIGAVVEQFGRLDIAFNNAGITAYKPIEDLTTDDVDRVLATNVKGVWLLVKHEVAQMRKQGHGGSIVNTSSVAATGGSVNLSVYTASKGCSGCHGSRIGARDRPGWYSHQQRQSGCYRYSGDQRIAARWRLQHRRHEVTATCRKRQVRMPGWGYDPTFG
jgi:hypothetical protein